ncbi:MAG TPA: biotin transporter BioY [Rickettsiales bacterium]|nr:biotin transporter BioY [Rickettsiales bacterium]
MYTTTYPVFIDTVFKLNKKSQQIIKNIILVLFGSMILAFSSKVSIPFYPVPFTMQTFAVLLIGGMYGSKLGTITVLAYIFEGLIGLPVFANGIGLSYVMGTTGGYLIGFLIAVYLVGKGAELGHDRLLFKSLLWFALGDIVLYTCGLSWLTYLFGFEKALTFGFYPFILSEIAKFILASLTLKSLWGYFPSNNNSI